MVSQVSFGQQKRPVVPFHLALPTPTHLILRTLTQPQIFSLPQTPPPKQHEQQQQQQHKQEQEQQLAEAVGCENGDRQQQQQQHKEAAIDGAFDSTCPPKQAWGRGPLETVVGASSCMQPTLRLVDYIISQNVDALHARCGVPLKRLGEVHGNMFVERCDSCARRYLRDFALPTLSFQPTGRLCGQSVGSLM